MNEAPCSCLVSTYRIEDLDSASMSRMFSSPGMPKTCVTPSFSRHCTISCALVLLIVQPYVACGPGLGLSAGGGPAHLRREAHARQVSAAGSASSRSAGIGTPHRRHR